MCVEEVASTSSHNSFLFDGFMVHSDVPPVTSSQQFIDDLATHLRITTGFTIPFDLTEHFSFTQLLVRTAQQTRQLVPPAARDDLGEGVVLGPCATASGSRQACGRRRPALRGWCTERWRTPLHGTRSRP